MAIYGKPVLVMNNENIQKILTFTPNTGSSTSMTVVKSGSDWTATFSGAGTGTLTVSQNLKNNVQMFLVGGGGGGGSFIQQYVGGWIHCTGGAGGGGGYTNTITTQLSAGQYDITIGSGGAAGASAALGGSWKIICNGQDGGNTKIVNNNSNTTICEVSGGAGGSFPDITGKAQTNGGNGGSGGGAGGFAYSAIAQGTYATEEKKSLREYAGNGGSNGASGQTNGANGEFGSHCDYGQGGTGQGNPPGTRAFGANSGTLYAGGGGGGQGMSYQSTVANAKWYGDGGARGDTSAGVGATRNTDAGSGTDGRGGGGGGGTYGHTAGNGGSGILIIRNAR